MFPSKISLNFLFLSLLFVSFLHAEDVNLALKKSYTLQPTPTYSYCTDPEDRVQLTDGQVTKDYFWTQKGTVGWVHVPYGSVTIDLGAVESIGRVEMTTAAGKAGVEFPRAVLVLVSEDGKVFHEACELMSDDFEVNGPLPKDYVIRNLTSKKLETKGRFVRVLILSSGLFAFTDEIRVFRGEKAPAEINVTTAAYGTVEETFKAVQTRFSLERRWQADYADLKGLIENSKISDSVKKDLLKRLEAVYAKRQAEINALPIDFQAVLPIGPVHAELYKIQAALWNAEKPKSAPVLVSACGLWDWLERFTSVKILPKAQIQVAAMQDETRSCAFCLFNTTQEKHSVQFQIKGLKKVARCTVYRVLWTDTGVLTPVACAMPEVKPADDGTFTVDVEPGLVQQVWIDFKTRNLKIKEKQKYEGSIEFVNGLKQEIPVALTVYPLVFPEKTTLMTGGWDYTNCKKMYNVTELNRADFVRCLKAHHVNAPWATNGVLMHEAKRNEDGSVSINTEEFDAWVQLWKPSEVREYYVFMALGGWGSKGTAPKFLGTEAGTPEFEQAIKSWLGAWAKHWAELGIRPNQINLLLHDEPNETMTDLKPFLAWSRAIHEACPGVKVWEDPCWVKFDGAPLDFFASCDVLCPNRPAWLQNPEQFAKFYGNQHKEGRELNLYSCSGPQRLLDPYAYMRLQAWHAAQIGATASFFWAMGDGGGVSSWNEYFLGRNSYCPLFVDPNVATVTEGKHLKAIAAGARDFEYIVMAKKKLGDSAKLAEIIQSVLKPEMKLEWKEPCDREAADRARVQILRILCEE